MCIRDSYSISMTVPGGEQVHHFGQYLEVDPPTRLVFTWVISNQPCEGSQGSEANTKVTLDLVSVGTSTNLSLLHEQLPSADAVKGHRIGWSGSLLRLSKHLTST